MAGHRGLLLGGARMDARDGKVETEMEYGRDRKSVV